VRGLDELLLLGRLTTLVVKTVLARSVGVVVVEVRGDGCRSSASETISSSATTAAGLAPAGLAVGLGGALGLLEALALALALVGVAPAGRPAG